MCYNAHPFAVRARAQQPLLRGTDDYCRCPDRECQPHRSRAASDPTHGRRVLLRPWRPEAVRVRHRRHHQGLHAVRCSLPDDHGATRDLRRAVRRNRAHHRPADATRRVRTGRRHAGRDGIRPLQERLLPAAGIRVRAHAFCHLSGDHDRGAGPLLAGREHRRETRALTMMMVRRGTVSGPQGVVEREYGIAPPGFRLPDDTHLGRVVLQVSSLERSVAYYETVLGLTVLHRTSTTTTLGARGSTDPIVELREKPGAHEVPRRGRIGLYHFAVLLPDRASLARFVAHLAEIGAYAGMSDHLVSEAVYLSDPDGLGI